MTGTWPGRIPPARAERPPTSTGRTSSSCVSETGRTSRRPSSDSRARSIRSATTKGVEVTAVQRSAEIVNADEISGSSAVLGGAIALSALASLALALTAAVHRRRRELALLKALGFTRRQVSATVAWQATSIIAVGLVIGVPARCGARPAHLEAVRRATRRRGRTGRTGDRHRSHGSGGRRGGERSGGAAGSLRTGGAVGVGVP